MQVIVCKEGHYYDSNKYRECPVCKRNAQRMEGDKTESKSSPSLEPRRVQPQYMEWKEAAEIADPNRTQMEQEELPINSYITGWLVCVEGPERGRDYRLRAGFNRIGRSHKMDVCIFEDDGISRNTHCSIVYEYRKNQFLLVPEGMTWKAEELLEGPVELVNGDRFKIGDTVLEFIAFCRGQIKWER